MVSTAQDVLEDLAAIILRRAVLEYRQLQKLKGTYLDALPVLADATSVSTRPSTRWARLPAAFFHESEPAEHPYPHGGRPEIAPRSLPRRATS